MTPTPDRLPSVLVLPGPELRSPLPLDWGPRPDRRLDALHPATLEDEPDA